MGEDEKSKLFADCIKDLYIKKKYEVEYAILQLEKYKDAGKINAEDYEKTLEYFKSEKDQQNTLVVEEQTESVQNETEVAENTVADETVENTEIVTSGEDA